MLPKEQSKCLTSIINKLIKISSRKSKFAQFAFQDLNGLFQLQPENVSIAFILLVLRYGFKRVEIALYAGQFNDYILNYLLFCNIN